ncbi:hypothetical protein FRC01_013113 [Tulasnella sp. 417]|nr:hypothetical protein FRC01_013113 [Tulasnella sp. 417]
MPIKKGQSDPSKQYRMLLNMIEQGGYATFTVENEGTGPSNQRTWSAIVTVTTVDPFLSNRIYIDTSFKGTGPTKSEANDAACEQMLHLFAQYDILPGMKLHASESDQSFE